LTHASKTLNHHIFNIPALESDLLSGDCFVLTTTKTDIVRETMEEGGAKKKRIVRKKMAGTSRGRGGEMENLLIETSRFLARIRQRLPKEQALEAGVLVSRLEAVASSSSSRDGSRERGNFPPPIPASKAQRANGPPPLPSNNIRKKFPQSGEGPTKSTPQQPPLPLVTRATPKSQQGKFEDLDTAVPFELLSSDFEKLALVKSDTTSKQPPTNHMLTPTGLTTTANDKIAQVVITNSRKRLSFSESESEDDEKSIKEEEPTATHNWMEIQGQAGAMILNGKSGIKVGPMGAPLGPLKSQGQAGSMMVPLGQSSIKVGPMGAPLAPEEEVDSDFVYSEDGNNHKEEEEQEEYLQEEEEEAGGEHSQKNGRADETYIEDEVVHAEEESNYLVEEEKECKIKATKVQQANSTLQSNKIPPSLPKQSPVKVRQGPPPPLPGNKPNSVKTTMTKNSVDLTTTKKAISQHGKAKTVTDLQFGVSREDQKTNEFPKPLDTGEEEEEAYDSMYDKNTDSVTQVEGKREISDNEAKSQILSDGRASSVTEEDEYDVVLPLSSTNPSAKLETKYDLAVPGTGGLITTAEVLNGKADQVGWLFRKEGILKSQKRYWVLIYDGVMYIYNDAKDGEPREKIKLFGAILKKLKDKNKDGKGFMLQIGKKKSKHEFETNDVKEARDWVRALEMEVNGRRANSGNNRANTIAVTGKSVAGPLTGVSHHESVPATAVTMTEPSIMIPSREDDIIEEEDDSMYDSMYDRPTSADAFGHNEESGREQAARKQCEAPETSQNFADKKSLQQGRRSFVPLPGSRMKSPSTPAHSVPAQPRGTPAGHQQVPAGQRRAGPPGPRGQRPRGQQPPGQQHPGQRPLGPAGYPGPCPSAGQPGRPGGDFGPPAARPSSQRSRTTPGQQRGRANTVAAGRGAPPMMDLKSELEARLKARQQL